MPVISRFYGLTVRMYFLASEHQPPHIHVVYGDDSAEISIGDGSLLAGKLPAKAMQLILEWLELHREELMEIWDTQIFNPIDPL
ncbi:MAG: DUF4160 domain-containing protein [Clostridiales bacterium]|nr:DUF4160 domain-containing protein [Candidatus Crickella equi]